MLLRGIEDTLTIAEATLTILKRSKYSCGSIEDIHTFQHLTGLLPIRADVLDCDRSGLPRNPRQVLDAPETTIDRILYNIIPDLTACNFYGCAIQLDAAVIDVNNKAINTRIAHKHITS